MSQEVSPGGQQPPGSAAAASGDPASDQTTARNGGKVEKRNLKGLKRAMTDQDVSILDARKEGNVGRFFNVRWGRAFLGD